MTLKQLTDLDRINFLKKFTTELVINATKEQERERSIQIEKLRQKFIRPKTLPDQTFKKIMRASIFEPSRELKERQEIKEQRIKQIEKFEEKKKAQRFEELKEGPSKDLDFREKLRRPIFHRAKTPRPIPIQKPKKSFLQKLKPVIKPKQTLKTAVCE